MTTVKFFKDKNIYTGFECFGHTGFSDAGTDILCSAISALTQSTYLGISKVLNLKCDMEKYDGYFKVIVLEDPLKAQDLFKTLKLALEDIKLGNEKYIQINTIKRSAKWNL